MSSATAAASSNFSHQPELPLPPAPAGQAGLAVQAWSEPVVLPTYRPSAPDRHPMFLERRVYQGSSGRVYPLPVVDRIADHAEPVAWEAIHLGNRFLRVMVLPGLGGRIHLARDLTNGYDLFYRQDVIKPALVGLAGPWCSGGVEFNWPQHHRPATWMPVDTCIERHVGGDLDGAVTVWCSDHDPMAGMKGMHGVRLRPDSAALEVVVRLHNRTEDVQTFLWWANAAVRVHDRYQSFFPTDVHTVADHARRAMSSFPLATGTYYGVDYGARSAPAADGVPADGVPRNDLTWYRNIPVPTSYMILGTNADFFGGYDHAAEAGVVHVADHRISPGKKQWTWGDHPFGHAWDRNLTDWNGPYIELMAGVYTDNQPDFSWLAPGETKDFVQRWFPIQRIGVAQAANEDAALHLGLRDGSVQAGVAPARIIADARIVLRQGGQVVRDWSGTLMPGAPWLESCPAAGAKTGTVIELALTADGIDLRFAIDAAGVPVPGDGPQAEIPPAATAPLAPDAIDSSDELYLTGLHLEQYRHAIARPETYWTEALRRDPGDSRCHLALGRWHRRRGELADAERHLRQAVARLTQRNGNPADGEAHYHLGLCLRDQGRLVEADAALAKACWNAAWQAPGHRALAELACRRGDWPAALDHLRRSLRMDGDHLWARNLRAMVLFNLERPAEAEAQLVDTLALDPLDVGCRFLLGQDLRCPAQARIDVAIEFARAGLHREALGILDGAVAEPGSGAQPLLHAWRARFAADLEDPSLLADELAAFRAASPDHCFPARLEEEALLMWLTSQLPDAAAPWLLLGHWRYDRRRHSEAIAAWERCVALDPGCAVAWRCLGIGRFNVQDRAAEAVAAYDAAVRAAPDVARLRFERDQLAKRLGVPAGRRIAVLEERPDLIAQRDDATVEYADLLCQVGRIGDASAILTARTFQPWEGGEGRALAVHQRIQLTRGRAALRSGDAASARRAFDHATEAPANLGEAWHLLQNQSESWFLQGEASAVVEDRAAAIAAWTRAAEFRGDFQGMKVQPCSEQTMWSALALRRLGRAVEADVLLSILEAHARTLLTTPATIDFFATSLPTLLLFTDDLDARQGTTARFLLAQAAFARGQDAEALAGLDAVLSRAPDHAGAADLRTALHARPAS